MTGYSEFVRIAIMSDRPSAMADNQPWAEANRPDEIDYFSIPEGMAALDTFASPTLIIVDLGACDALADQLLDRLDVLGRSLRQQALVIFTPALLDAVVARVAAPSIALLCDPTPLDRVSAIALCLESARTGATSAQEQTAQGLKSLADEVARIAKALAALAGDDLRPGGDVFSDGLVGYRAGSASQIDGQTAVSASEVRALIQARRLRDRFLLPDLFGEPAWDILLDLFAARIERTPVAVSSLCIAAAVPPTTALRTIRNMTERGLLARIDDVSDRRRVFIALTDGAAAQMSAYIVAARAVNA